MKNIVSNLFAIMRNDLYKSKFGVFANPVSIIPAQYNNGG